MKRCFILLFHLCKVKTYKYTWISRLMLYLINHLSIVASMRTRRDSFGKNGSCKERYSLVEVWQTGNFLNLRLCLWYWWGFLLFLHQRMFWMNEWFIWEASFSRIFRTRSTQNFTGSSISQFFRAKIIVVLLVLLGRISTSISNISSVLSVLFRFFSIRQYFVYSYCSIPHRSTPDIEGGPFLFMQGFLLFNRC